MDLSKFGHRVSLEANFQCLYKLVQACTSTGKKIVKILMALRHGAAWRQLSFAVRSESVFRQFCVWDSMIFWRWEKATRRPGRRARDS